MCDAGEYRCPTPQERNKPADEHRLCAVSLEEFVDLIDLALVQAHIATVTMNERKTAFASGPITEAVAHDRAERRGSNDAGYMEPARRGDRGSRDESGLAGQWYAETFHGNDQKQKCIAVGSQQSVECVVHD